LTFEELFAGRGLDIDQMKSRIKRTAKEVGLPMGDRNRTYNSRLAQELGKWAESKAKGDAYHSALFHAYFVDGKNIAEPQILIELTDSIGLPAETASDVLKERTFSGAVDDDWSRSYHMGITAVPTFVAGDLVLVGAQPYEALEKLMIVSGALKKHGLSPKEIK
jgi:predicted DsbA family dithiol-disulfide isomerase